MAESEEKVESKVGRKPSAREHGKFPWSFAFLGLLALFVVLHAAAFAVYSASHPDGAVCVRVWGYGESDLATLITASLVIPLLMFLVESRFNVGETIRSTRLERERKALDERREARLATIERTAGVLSDFFRTSTEVTSRREPLDFSDLRGRAYEFPVVASQLMNTWKVRFPNLEGETELFDAYSQLLTIGNECTASTMFYLQQIADADERDALRGSLDLIAGAIDGGVDYPVLNILNASLELMELRETPSILRGVEFEPQRAADEAKWRRQIADNIAVISSTAETFQSYLPAQGQLATIDGPPVDGFRKLFSEIAPALRDGDARTSPRSSELENAYLEIPRSARFRAWSVKYTPQLLGSLADKLAFQEILADPQRRRRNGSS
ncbi:MAG TPA: hypothetical protein VNN80_34415 [Polyangiaceae bacterium]|jgi:hypothetical protein|nr:hypothetical protein [Polyangiaceae bacterium]